MGEPIARPVSFPPPSSARGASLPGGGARSSSRWTISQDPSAPGELSRAWPEAQEATLSPHEPDWVARATANAAVTSRAEELVQLRDELAVLHGDLALAETRLATAQEHEAAADEMVGAMLTRVAEIEGKLRASQAETAAAETRAAALAAHLGKLRATTAEAEERLRAVEAREAEIGPEGDDRAALRDRVAQLEGELSALRRDREEERAAAEAASSAAEQRIAELTATGARQKQTIEDARRARASSQDELVTAIGEIDALAVQKAEAERRAAAAEQEVTELRARASEAAHQPPEPSAAVTKRQAEQAAPGEARRNHDALAAEVLALRQDLAAALTRADGVRDLLDR